MMLYFPPVGDIGPGTENSPQNTQDSSMSFDVICLRPEQDFLRVGYPTDVTLYRLPRPGRP
jgi:hypothetical protein